MILSVDTKKRVELALFEYPELYKKAAVSVVEYAESNMAVRYDKLLVQGSPLANSEEILCGIIDKDLEDYKWCVAVEKVLKLFAGKQEEKTIRAYFFERNTVLETCNKAFISRCEFYRQKEDIIEATYLLAKELGAIE